MDAIGFQSVSKRYLIGQKTFSLRERVAEMLRWPQRLDLGVSRERGIWALKDVNLTISKGESLGVIGPNGSGKTTLLKLLSRVTYPTEGKVEVKGRIGNLIELGAGFHPDLTGKENIYLNGAILGLTKREIKEKFDQIVEFAELDRFIYMPVKKYSSGMYIRLGFSVAVHVGKAHPAEPQNLPALRAPRNFHLRDAGERRHLNLRPERRLRI